MWHAYPRAVRLLGRPGQKPFLKEKTPQDTTLVLIMPALPGRFVPSGRSSGGMPIRALPASQGLPQPGHWLLGLFAPSVPGSRGQSLFLLILLLLIRAQKIG